MKMQVGKWGNSLAVRLPRDVVDAFGLKEGDTLDSDDFKEALEKAKRLSDQQRREAALERIRMHRWKLPADWKFDREEANWRPAMDKW